MNRRYSSRQAADRARAARSPWRKWYASRAWRERRRRQLTQEPFCRTCKAAGRTRIATVADHDPPHRGDHKAFFHGNLQSLCEPCHSAAKQREELDGFHREIDADGYPTDPRHPFNRRK